MGTNKQTAVEWLINQLETKGDAWVNMSIDKIQISIKEEEYINLIQQAKAMESNEQVINVPIYYYEDEDNVKVYDFEEMTKEFELALSKL